MLDLQAMVYTLIGVGTTPTRSFSFYFPKPSILRAGIYKPKRNA